MHDTITTINSKKLQTLKICSGLAPVAVLELSNLLRIVSENMETHPIITPEALQNSVEMVNGMIRVLIQTGTLIQQPTTIK